MTLCRARNTFRLFLPYLIFFFLFDLNINLDLALCLTLARLGPLPRLIPTQHTHLAFPLLERSSVLTDLPGPTGPFKVLSLFLPAASPWPAGSVEASLLPRLLQSALTKDVMVFALRCPHPATQGFLSHVTAPLPSSNISGQ